MGKTKRRWWGKERRAPSPGSTPSHAHWKDRAGGRSPGLPLRKAGEGMSSTFRKVENSDEVFTFSPLLSVWGGREANSAEPGTISGNGDTGHWEGGEGRLKTGSLMETLQMLSSPHKGEMDTLALITPAANCRTTYHLERLRQ